MSESRAPDFVNNLLGPFVLDVEGRNQAENRTPAHADHNSRYPSIGQLSDLPSPDVQLILDLLACHAPSKTAEAIAALIKQA